MKILLFLISILFFGINTFAQSGQIKLTITKIKVKNGGNVKIGIYKKEGFLSTGDEILNKDVKATDTKVNITFYDIPVGKYAIATFQDTNSDGKLNTNVLGLPSEPNGFSKNKKGKYGPPDFKDVAFHVENGKSTSLTINLE